MPTVQPSPVPTASPTRELAYTPTISPTIGQFWLLQKLRVFFFEILDIFLIDAVLRNNVTW